MPAKNRVSPYQATDQNKQQCRFFQISFKDLLTILFSAILPLVIAIHTIVVTEQENQLAAELRQQEIYDEFLNNIYKLHKHGELDERANPWIFANAHYQSAHRQWDLTRKQYSLQFLKEKRLIGRGIVCRINESGSITGFERKKDIINLTKMNFDGIILASSTENLYPLDMKGVIFDQVSMVGVKFSSINLDCAEFHRSHLNGASFENASLASALFNASEVHGVNFGNANMAGARFYSTDLRQAHLSTIQVRQSKFYNCLMPKGVNLTTEIMTTRKYHWILSCDRCIIHLISVLSTI